MVTNQAGGLAPHWLRRIGRTFAAAAALVLASTAFAQSSSTHVKITISYVAPDEKSEIAIDCYGEPTCTGTYTEVFEGSDCSNIQRINGSVTITGLNLAAPGSFQGTVTLSHFDWDETVQGGVCTIVPGSFRPATIPYTATWNGTTGTATVHNLIESWTGTFAATRSAAPVFQMTVTGSVGATANIQANIQYRPQDVGTTGSVYVFAVAPSTVVKNAVEKAALLPMTAKSAGKDTPVQCVLAQLNSAGELQSVSPSALQASISGTLSAGGQAITVLDGVPTANIAGSTFFVGYGPDATTMYNSGVNRSAVNIPGTATCQPQAPQTGWWWNPAEDGRGYSIEVQANKYFFAAFLYDVSGRASWYVATGEGATLDGSLINGSLLEARGGQSLGGAYPGSPTITTVGPITLAFNDASHGTMVWPGGTVPIERFNIVPNGLTLAAQANQPEAGWWWNPAESGRGFFMEWQGGVLDIAGYMYDESGNPIWYLTENLTPSTNLQQFSSNWWQFADGMTLMGPWKPNRQVSNNVAPVTIQFSGPENAIMTLPNGRTTTLQRHRF